MKIAINGAVLKDKKILLVRKGQTWILPGGKPEGNESDLECLCREFQEELSGTTIESLRFYGKFDGITPHSREPVRAIVYFANINGELHPPSAEIRESAWVGDGDLGRYNLSDTTSKIMASLKKGGYVA